MNKLDDFQEKGINDLSRLLLENQSVIGVAPAGAGKTVILSSISHRFISKSNKDVVIFVHKEELASQTREKLFSWYGIISQLINSETKTIAANARVFVIMVETFHRRTKFEHFRSYFSNVGLAIFDECHLSYFKKIMPIFGAAKRIGLTATPLAATKSDPLKNWYQSISIISTIGQMIELNDANPKRGVVRCEEYSLRNIDRRLLRVRGDDFDEDQMGEIFSQGRQIENTINAYIKHGYGRKTICFNANISHSLLMHEAFIQNGMNSRHLDGNRSGKYGNDRYREDCFKWLKKTPNAILCNVGIATIGFDEPSIETVIINKSTKSFPLFYQMRGRGGRPYEYPDGTHKEHFLLLDMGDNIKEHGRYEDNIDFERLFWHPRIPTPGVSPIKTCPLCGSINNASARRCFGLFYDFLLDDDIECEYEFDVGVAGEDLIPKEMVKISGGIDVKRNIEFFRDRNEYVAMYETIKQIANMARQEIDGEYLDAEYLEHLYQVTYDKVGEWFKLIGKRKWPKFKEQMQSHIIIELKKVGFMVMAEEIIETQNQII